MKYTLPEFLAHAIAMEDEAAERYLELADMMEAHNNLDVATVFRDMCRFSQMHRDSIKERAGDAELPRPRSWQFRWQVPPEVCDEEAFDYTLTPYQALQFARDNEQRAIEFYRAVIGKTDDAEVKRLASEFADEEQEHTDALDKWLERTPPD